MTKIPNKKVLDIGILNLEFIWCLGFVIWNLKGCDRTVPGIGE